LLLVKTALVMNDLTGASLAITIAESEVGISGQEITYSWNQDEFRERIIGGGAHEFNNLSYLNSVPYHHLPFKRDFGIYPDSYIVSTEESPIYINYRMFDPALDNGAGEAGDNIISGQIYQKDLSNSFQQYGTMMELLAAIAKSLGCYIFVTYSTGTAIEIEFVAMQNLAKAEVFIKDIESSSLDTSSIMEEDKISHFSQLNGFMTDKYDYMETLYEDGEYLEFDTRKREQTKRVDYEKLLFSTGIGIFNARLEQGKKAYNVTGKNYYLPINLNMREDTDYRHPFHDYLYNREMATAGQKDSNYFKNANIGQATNQAQSKMLTSGLIYKHESLGTVSPDVYRPAGRILIDKDGVTQTYDRLADYINDIGSQFKNYETEYKITVPFWSGFSETDGNSGDLASWNILQLGSIIKMTSNIQTLSGTTFTNDTDTDEYMVVEIERNLQYPETIITLKNTSKYAFGYYDSASDKPGEGPLAGGEEGGGGLPEDDPYKLTYECGESITAGDVVQIQTDGTINVALADSAEYGTTIGIALEDGVITDEIEIQKTGDAGYDGTLTIGKAVYWLTGAITQDLSNITPTTSEDMIIYLGIADSAESFILNIREFTIA